MGNTFTVLHALYTGGGKHRKTVDCARIRVSYLVKRSHDSHTVKWCSSNYEYYVQPRTLGGSYEPPPPPLTPPPRSTRSSLRYYTGAPGTRAPVFPSPARMLSGIIQSQFLR